LTQKQQSREFDVSDLSSISIGEKERIKYLTQFQVPREGLFDVVMLEPSSQSAILKITQKAL